VIEGEEALDPSNPSLGSQYELPHSKLTVAFWFSPDSTKVLLLTAAGKNKEDIVTQKSQFRVALNSGTVDEPIATPKGQYLKALNAG
jgi:hypothetical protein